MNFETRAEHREIPDFKLTIVIHRHGPRNGEGLSSEGRQETASYFEDAYEGVTLDLPEGQGVDIVHSPVERTTETAQIAARTGGQPVRSVTTDERLAERGTSLPWLWKGKLSQHRVDRWMETPSDATGLAAAGSQVERLLDTIRTKGKTELVSGKKNARDFAEWLLEKINTRKQAGGTQEIDAYSHFPIMLSFLYTIEKKMNISVLPENWREMKSIKDLIPFLDYMNFYIDSKQPSTVRLSFQGKALEVPLQVIQEISEGV